MRRLTKPLTRRIHNKPSHPHRSTLVNEDTSIPCWIKLDSSTTWMKRVLYKGLNGAFTLRPVEQGSVPRTFRFDTHQESLFDTGDVATGKINGLQTVHISNQPPT